MGIYYKPINIDNTVAHRTVVAWPHTQRCQTRLSESVSSIFVDTGSWDGDKVFTVHIKQTRQADKTSRFSLAQTTSRALDPSLLQ